MQDEIWHLIKLELIDEELRLAEQVFVDHLRCAECTKILVLDRYFDDRESRRDCQDFGADHEDYWTRWEQDYECSDCRKNVKFVDAGIIVDTRVSGEALCSTEKR